MFEAGNDDGIAGPGEVAGSLRWAWAVVALMIGARIAALVYFGV